MSVSHLTHNINFLLSIYWVRICVLNLRWHYNDTKYKFEKKKKTKLVTIPTIVYSHFIGIIVYKDFIFHSLSKPHLKVTRLW